MSNGTMNGDDNRRRNLRAATHNGNMQNIGIQKNNTSGFKGVYWNKRNRNWGAQITVGGVNRGLGLFTTKEEAALAYDAACLELHGEFARTNEMIGGVTATHVGNYSKAYLASNIDYILESGPTPIDIILDAGSIETIETSQLEEVAP